jgi:hypothetical protein
VAVFGLGLTSIVDLGNGPGKLNFGSLDIGCNRTRGIEIVAGESGNRSIRRPFTTNRDNLVGPKGMLVKIADNQNGWIL